MNIYYIHEYLSEHENFTQKLFLGLPTKLVKNPIYSTNIKSNIYRINVRVRIKTILRAMTSTTTKVIKTLRCDLFIKLMYVCFSLFATSL